jgi:multiple sugar transport system substrate-binding protein
LNHEEEHVKIPRIALVIAVLAASAASFGQKASGPVKIIYYLWDDPSIKIMVDSFNAAQKDIAVDARYIPAADYDTKITTLLTAKAEADAYMLRRQGDMYAHYDNGFIEPLDDLLKRTGVDRSAVDAYKDAVSIDGKVVAFPWRGASYYTYYNKKVFAKAGIPTPDVYVKRGEWTWAKFAEVAKKISSGDGKVLGASVYFWGSSQAMMEAQRFKPIIDAKGKIDYDGAILSWFKMRKDLEAAKAMWPFIDMKVTKTHYTKQFYDGNVGMLLIGEWFPSFMMKGRDDKLLVGYGWNDWGVTRLPCDGKDYATWGTPIWSHVTSYSKNKEAALRFIAWMGGPEGAKVAAKAGVLPAMMTPEVKDILRNSLPDAQSVDYFTEPRRIYPILLSKYGPSIDNFLGTFMEKYLLGKVSDADFDASLRSSLKEIVDTTD